MITPYALNGLLAEPASSGEESIWLDVEDPTSEELDRLHKEFGISQSFLKDPLDMAERPRIEKGDGHLLIIARASREGGSTRAPFSTFPLGLIITPDRLITVCRLPGLARGLLPGKIRYRTSNPPLMLALSLLMRMSAVYIQHLSLMDSLTGDIEQSLNESLRNRELMQLLHVEKTLIYFRTALKGNTVVLERLVQSGHVTTDNDLKEYLDDVVIECRQATDMAEIFSQILGSLGDTFGTVVSNNLNKVMKILTSLTIVLMIPPIISGLYGMNVALPFMDSPHAFSGLIAFSVVLCAGLLYYFWKKDWM